MIDPKFNSLPVDAEGDFEHIYDNSLSAEENADRVRQARQGLSIQDTIAGDTLLSTGARGLDTSGVEAGSGAGAGMTFVTPGGPGESPAPNIVGGARGSGSTVRADGPVIQDAAPLRVDAPDTSAMSSQVLTPVYEPTSVTSVDFSTPVYESTTGLSSDVSALAYQRWCERGCPQGSPEIDWHAAEEELRTRRYKTTAV